MKHEDVLRKLSRLARAEPVPTVDVAEVVMDRVRSTRETLDWPMAIMTGVSAAAATIVLVFASQTWFTLHDPIVGLFYSLSMVME